MNKTELVNALASGSGLTKTDVSKVLELFTETVKNVLKDGDTIAMPGLGTFSTGHRSARTGRNPQTGAMIEIKASRVAKFKAAKMLKEAVQAAK